MTILYTSLLLAHVVSALGFFAVQGVAGLTAHEINSANDAQEAKRALKRVNLVEKLMAPLPPVLLLSGIGLCAVAWGFSQPWVILSLLGFVATAALARGVDVPHLRRAHALLEQGASFEADVRPVLHAPGMRRSRRAHHGLLVWLVLLMVVKPALAPALLALALVLAPALAVPVRAAPRLRASQGA